MILCQFLEKIRFLYNSENAHGLHSPFVFDFYNSVKKQAKSLDVEKYKGFTKRQSRIFYAVISYLKAESVLIVKDESSSISNLFYFSLNKDKISTANSLSELSNEFNKFDIIYIPKSLLISEKDLLANLQGHVYNHSAVIIPHIHASKNSINQWKCLIKKNSFSVSLDLFFIGVLFFRKESTKQDFQLRF